MGTERRSGLQRFGGPQEAKGLHEVSMMSFPTMNPPAEDQMMEWALSSGQVVKVLYGDPEAGGMSLVWSWFAPHFPLPRHSHSADCLYFVHRGELRMGNQVVKEGEGFFVPKGRALRLHRGTRRRRGARVPRPEPVRHADHRKSLPLEQDGGDGSRAP